jgi:hypothetical protein
MPRRKSAAEKVLSMTSDARSIVMELTSSAASPGASTDVISAAVWRFLIFAKSE